jgi:hypothetical protein
VTDNNVAAVLALVQGQGVEEVEAELPAPPANSSVKGSALWYALLGAYEFNLGEKAILEQLVTVQTHLDEVEADWRHDGSPTMAEGSMGQPVADPRIQEMRQLRSQYAALIKQLNLPTDGGEERRRPGRPTRSEGGGKWGAQWQ